jgi:SulP family sulfate permease
MRKAVAAMARKVRRQARGPAAGDVIAGVTVGLLLVPQSLAYATLVGVPAVRGLYVAAAATLAAAPFASSPYLQTGPVGVTALLAVGAVSGLAAPQTHEYLALMILLALVVGTMRLMVGLMRMGGIAYLMSQPVLAGFMPAAALVIVASQVPAALGVDAGAHGLLAGAASVLSHPGRWDTGSVAMALVTLALMFGGRLVHQLFPGVLLAVVVGILVGRLDAFHGPLVGSVHAGFPPLPRHLPWSTVPHLLVPGLVIAVVGFAEASAIARTFATSDRTNWDPNREFVSQGMANLAAGAVGGFPVGGSLSRSSLNRFAGARTQWSGAISGLTVLAALPFVSLVSSLPKAVLGTIVIGSIVGFLHPGPVLELRHYSRLQFAVSAATFVLTLALSPRVQLAVVIGVVLAVAAHLRREFLLSVPTWSQGEEVHLKPKGVLYFGSAPSLERTFVELLSEHPEARRLIVHLDGLGRVDVTGALALQALLTEAREAGLEAEVADVPPQAAKIVARVLDRPTRKPPPPSAPPAGPPPGSALPGSR